MYSSRPESNDSFSERRRETIKETRFDNQKDPVLKTEIDRPEFLEGQREPLDMEIKKIARDNEDVRLLMTIPGIDYYPASLLSSYIGDVNRFPNKDKLASFFGLIPETRVSSTIKKRGHLSKEGAATARWALSIAVDMVTLRNKSLKKYYNSVKNRKGSEKYAHVSTDEEAHKDDIYYAQGEKGMEVREYSAHRKQTLKT